MLIHDKKFNVNDNEFNVIHKELFPLKIRKNVSEFDREISFIKKLFMYGSFLNIGCTHGGYVPILVSDMYDNVYINTDNINSSQQNNLLENIQHRNVNNISFNFQNNKNVICRIEPGINTITTNDIFKIIISDINVAPKNYTCLKFTNRFVYVHDSVKNMFYQQFGYCIRQNELFYDNLINLLIMVKNAGENFRNILSQNLYYIDRWTILDTGSTDNTVQIIKEVMKNKKGNLYQEPFINFKESRNRLLELAGKECVYNIMLDDTYIVKGDIRQCLSLYRGDDFADSFSLSIMGDDVEYSSNRITKTRKNLKYKYTIHEIIEPNVNVKIKNKDCYLIDKTSEYMTERTSNRKLRDLELLYKELEIAKESENKVDVKRTLYYLAETNLCVKRWKETYDYYKKRSEYDDEYHEEVQDSLYKMAFIGNTYLGKTWPETHELYLRCFSYEPKKAESLFMIGKHYVENNQTKIGFMYLKEAYKASKKIKESNFSMNIRKNIYYKHLPMMLISLCYTEKDFKLGLEVSEVAIKYSGNELAKNWNKIFSHLLQIEVYKHLVKKRFCTEKLVCFVAPGGWNSWDGETLRTKGLGGSETCIIKFSEYTSKQYKTIVFCKCEVERTYNGVLYIPITNFAKFVCEFFIDVCFVSRYTELLPVVIENKIPNIYLMLHDLAKQNEIIPMNNNLKNIICLSEWHKEHISGMFSSFKDKISVMSYGIDINDFPKEKIVDKSFIYSSFPNRGLIELLRMFPVITEKYPDATLNIFCNTKLQWVRDVAGKDMVEIERLIDEQDNVTNHGWVPGNILKKYWSSSHIWFYPCTFEETCCLTAYEAAASKTLVVSNHLAALKESIGDRGIIVNGNPETENWKKLALKLLFNVLDGSTETSGYIDRNYEWVKTKNYEYVTGDFIDKYIKT